MTLVMVLGSIYATVFLGLTGLNWSAMTESGNYLVLITHIFIPNDLSHLILEWILVAAFWHNGYSRHVHGRTRMAFVFLITCIVAGTVTAFLYSMSPKMEHTFIYGCTAGVYGWFGFVIPDLVRRKQWVVLAKTFGFFAFVGILYFPNLPVHFAGLFSGILLELFSSQAEHAAKKDGARN